MFDWRDYIRFVLYPSALLGFMAMMYGIAWAQSANSRAAHIYLPPIPPNSDLQRAIASMDP